MVDVKESLWDKACKNTDSSPNETKERHKIRYLLVVGSEGVGKSELLMGFYDRSNMASTVKTLGMDYTFGRRAGRSLEKNIVNVWELGGGTKLVATTDSVFATAAETIAMAGMAIILMLDLSSPNKLWATLEDMLTYIRAAIKKQTSKNFPTFKKALQAEAYKRIGKERETNKEFFEPFLIPLIIIGGKYDLFQDFDSEKRKIICHCLRYVAHSVGATLLFYSSKDVTLVKRARDTLMLYGFGHNSIMPSICQDYNKPLYIPGGTDSLENIRSGLPALNKESGKVCFLSHFPQDIEQFVMPDDPAKDPNFREVAIDTLRALKEEELIAGTGGRVEGSATKRTQ